MIVRHVIQFITIRQFPPADKSLPPLSKSRWWIATGTKTLALISEYCGRAVTAATSRTLHLTLRWTLCIVSQIFEKHDVLGVGFSFVFRLRSVVLTSFVLVRGGDWGRNRATLNKYYQYNEDQSPEDPNTAKLRKKNPGDKLNVYLVTIAWYVLSLRMERTVRKHRR
jgi:hypothetical protein